MGSIYSHDMDMLNRLTEKRDIAVQNVEKNREKYWEGFPRELPGDYVFPKWAIGPFTKYEHNPVFAPDEDGWDCGHFGGGVHNGSVVVKDGVFYYLYRGEFPIPEDEIIEGKPQYKCDCGLAISDNGIDWKRAAGPFFRGGGDEKFSFEDFNLAIYDGKYYLVCNRWDWEVWNDPKQCGVFLAVSDDLYNWEKIGLVFPKADRIHRNAAIMQNTKNEAVRVNGKFTMFINDGIIAYSEDMIHWKSETLNAAFAGGECSFAVCDYDADNPDNVILFTGGANAGRHYAVGEVLFNKHDLKTPVEWLPRPVIYTEPQYPWENCWMIDGKTPNSGWYDTVFLTYLTLHEGKWYAYYGGSEYYSCLATAPYTHR